MSVVPCQLQSAVPLVLLTRVSPGKELAPCQRSLTSQRLRSRGNAGQGMAFPGLGEPRLCLGQRGCGLTQQKPGLPPGPPFSSPPAPLMAGLCPSQELTIAT